MDNAFLQLKMKTCFAPMDWREIFTLLVLCFPICKMELLIRACWARQGDVLENTSLNETDLIIHYAEKLKAMGKAGFPTAWDLSPLPPAPGGCCFLLKGEPFREIFYGHCWKHRGYSKTQRHKSIEWEISSILLGRHKLLTRRRHFPSWSSPDEGESFYFLNDILIR